MQSLLNWETCKFHLLCWRFFLSLKVTFSGCVWETCRYDLRQDVREPGRWPSFERKQGNPTDGHGPTQQCQLQLLEERFPAQEQPIRTCLQLLPGFHWLRCNWLGANVVQCDWVLNLWVPSSDWNGKKWLPSTNEMSGFSARFWLVDVARKWNCEVTSVPLCPPLGPRRLLSSAPEIESNLKQNIWVSKKILQKYCFYSANHEEKRRMQP